MIFAIWDETADKPTKTQVFLDGWQDFRDYLDTLDYKDFPDIVEFVEFKKR
mgnify:CR=1 FL=1|jgi:hypothetical protein